MSPAAQDFFNATGLQPDAAPLDIRRAYARALKQIDQAADPASFQRLRAAYELVLANLGRSSAEPAAEPPQADPHTSRHQGRDVLDAALAEWTGGAFAHGDATEAVLAAALDDARLLDLDARDGFERAVVSLLAQGWRPGHENLFAAAVELFGWHRDATRLQRFGQPGVVIDAAVREMLSFHHFPVAMRTPIRDLMQAWRGEAAPSTHFVQHHLRLAEQSCAGFPHWLHVVSRPAQLARWQAQAQRIPRWRQAMAPRPLTLAAEAVGRRTIRPRVRSSRAVGRACLAALLLVSALARMLGTSEAALPRQQNHGPRSADGAAVSLVESEAWALVPAMYRAASAPATAVTLAP